MWTYSSKQSLILSFGDALVFRVARSAWTGNGAGERNSEPGGADETRCRANLFDTQLRCRLQMRLRIRIGTMKSWVASKSIAQKCGAGCEKFKRYKIVAVFVTDESSHAADSIFVGF